MNNLYYEDITNIQKISIDFLKLKDKTILITGATGLIGTPLVDIFCFLNETYNLNITLLLVSRTERKSNKKYISYIKHDINNPLNISQKIDFIIHAASNTHPVQYTNFPIETITTNFLGTYNLLNLSLRNNSKFLLLSSVEIYGNQNIDLENGFSEKDMGYLDCNLARSGYCESKRVSETLCQSFKQQYNIDFITARLCRCYGSTLRKDDSKALSQFIFNGLNNENIILKSKGNQYYSYLYSVDAAIALLFLLLNGVSGEAYNISDINSNIHLSELAAIVANICNVKVIYDLPNEIEKKGFSNSSIAILDSSKINSLGWKPFYNIEQGLKRTIEILKNS